MLGKGKPQAWVKGIVREEVLFLSVNIEDSNLAIARQLDLFLKRGISREDGRTEEFVRESFFLGKLLIRDGVLGGWVQPLEWEMAAISACSLSEYWLSHLVKSC